MNARKDLRRKAGPVAMLALTFAAAFVAAVAIGIYSQCWKRELAEGH